MEEEQPDIVAHPPHYTQGKYECIEVIEDWDMGYHLGNALKYLRRYNSKHKSLNKQIEDLEKAIWYIQRKIEMMRNENEGRP